jgi:DNA-nicking Smr family endonuclease
VRIITGKGLHSPAEPKLLVAVREWLQASGLNFTEHAGFFEALILAGKQNVLGPGLANGQ